MIIRTRDRKPVRLLIERSCGIRTSVPGTTMADHGAHKDRTAFQKSLAAPSPDDSGHRQRMSPCRHCESRGFPSRKIPSRSDNINAYRQVPVLEKEPVGGGITYFNVVSVKQRRSLVKEPQRMSPWVTQEQQRKKTRHPGVTNECTGLHMKPKPIVSRSPAPMMQIQGVPRQEYAMHWWTLHRDTV